jgi:hypothetical protein
MSLSRIPLPRILSVSRILLAAILAASVTLPATAIAAQPDQTPAAIGTKAKTTKGKTTKGKTKPQARTKITVKKRWTGYGFLPGYRQPPALTDWRAQNRISAWRALHEPRYLAIYPYSGNAQLRYGWGEPGIYRGRWNGGSFGPCWTQTPIGMIWNCGQ